MKIGDLVKVKRSPFHSWNGIIIGWYFDQLEVLVLQNKRGTKNITLLFDPKTMEIVNESG
tara:strand:- start:390 stop:569 length:180 start_codon:yes stop_codon:yes gene_type:complete